MFKYFIFFTTLISSLTNNLFAQDTLPKISVKNINKQIIISWKNNYGAKISYINIQRSRDSLKNFRTIGSVLNPLNRENGYLDAKADSIIYFYRVFVAFTGGNYFFSTSKKPIIDTIRKKEAASVETAVEATAELPLTVVPILTPSSTKTIKGKKATEEEDLLPARKFYPKRIPVGFVPNKFIFTDKDNNVIINLPDAEKENYSLRFFDVKGKLILEIKKITESYLIAEKVNFLHTGWFYYFLYNDGIFLDKYKFFIGKDGRIGPPPPEIKNSIDTLN